MCGASVFNVTVELPEGWEHDPISAKSIEPGELDAFIFRISIPEDTAPGNYTTVYHIENINSSLITTKIKIFEII